MTARRYVGETANGAVQGCFNGRAVFFGGIPYAAPVAGAARFRPPAPPAPWRGVRAAVHPGPVVNQNPTRFDPFLGPDPQPQSEDALSLNIWTPAADRGKRPVYVWIHGGAYVSGSGSFPLYDGSSFAQSGDIVCVSINYRLGERGYLHLGHLDPAYAGSGNNALLDQVRALEWVRDNIASFGGDPGQVTVGGQSAGGGSITGLMMMKQARSLFHRAIIQSIALMSFRDVAHAKWATAKFMEEAGVSDIAALEAAPMEVLLKAQRATMRARPPWRKVAFQPVVDDVVLKQDILESAAAGGLGDVPVLIGITGDEWKPFQFFMDPADVPRDEAALEAFVRQAMGEGTSVLAYYREQYPERSVNDLFGAVLSDWRWRRPTMALASMLCDRQSVYCYEFAWKSPAHDGRLGAGHCVELPFCFNNMATPSTPYLIGGDAPQALADHMHGSWRAFIRSGNPATDKTGAWPAYDTERRATMIFDEDSRVVDDPHAHTRTFWQNRTEEN